jgi:hypothetical protein
MADGLVLLTDLPPTLLQRGTFGGILMNNKFKIVAAQPLSVAIRSQYRHQMQGDQASA